MGIIVAIGGGENGRPGTKYETEKLDKEIIQFCNKSTPNFLFIGLANTYSDSYYNVMCKIYKNKFNCKTDHLTEENVKSKKISKEKIDRADIIYVGGGNTLRLMNLLRKNEIDILLKNAYLQNKVMCGVSAGAICWCDFGNSNSRKFTSNSNQLIKVTGLGFIHLLMCPHFNVEKNRKIDLPRMMKNTYKIPAIALDNGSALVINGEKFKIISSIKNAKAFKCFYSKSEYFEQIIEQNKYQNLDILYGKIGK